MEDKSRKRAKTCSEQLNDDGPSNFPAQNLVCYENDVNRAFSNVNGQNDPVTLPMLLENLADGKYGSVTKEFEALRAQNMQTLDVLYALRSSCRRSNLNSPAVSPTSNLVSPPKSGQNLSEASPATSVHSCCPTTFQNPRKNSQAATSNSIKNMNSSGNFGHQDPHLANQPKSNDMEVIVIDSDDETEFTEPSMSSRQGANDNRHLQMVPVYRDQPKAPFLGSNYGPIDVACKNGWQPSVQYQKVTLTNNTGKNLAPNLVDEKQVTNFSVLRRPSANPRPRNSKNSPRIADPMIKNVDKNNVKQNKFQSSTTEEVISNDEESLHSESMSESDSEVSETDGLDDLWRDMSLAMECLNGDIVGVAPARKQEEQDCDHSYILKDDLGLVCRMCGIIGKSIENIFDYPTVKSSRTTRTNFYDPRNSRDNGKSFSFSGLKTLEQELLEAEIAIHPRHQKQMKPHQLEGFSFLVRNLVCDKPGGCILAHAPGSGKTFMLISFIQSFLAKHPFAKTLIILPKGILSTWKKEFKKWQVEDIPLYDFYSVKADGRNQQLEVLKKWVEEKSILFLGYKQFSNIVCDLGTSTAAVQCRDSLLKFPTLLILDEGHFPRNDSTNVLQSLVQIQTPRKVVLSGTLFQNHVKEVFNILNLVRPKFLKQESSRAFVKRIMNCVQIPGARKQFRTVTDAAFFESVEDTLQNVDEDNFKRKTTVIRELREMTKEVLHYYKGDFLEELPGLVDFAVLLKMSPSQKATVNKLVKMDKFKKFALCSAIYMHPCLNEISEYTLKEKGHVHEGVIDGIIDKLDVSDGIKTKFFLNILSMAVSSGEKVLVYSQYILPLKFLERFLARTKSWRNGIEMFMISGDSSPEQRELAMEQINKSSDAKILFGSIKACGEGISLVGASRVIILDVHLNPSVSRQAIGRAFRPGQTKKVYVYRLVATDSLEEEHHNTSFTKERTSKMWFEWNQYRDPQLFELEDVDIQDSEDVFFEKPSLKEDVKCLYRRPTYTTSPKN